MQKENHKCNLNLIAGHKNDGIWPQFLMGAERPHPKSTFSVFPAVSSLLQQDCGDPVLRLLWRTTARTGDDPPSQG